ncbi:MAG: DUF11 domain-containing protein, partial [Actinomycetota bacterium]
NDSAVGSTSIARQVALAVTVAESADPVAAGSGAGNLIYTVTVANAGPVDATGLTLSSVLTLPTGVTADSQVPSTGTFSGSTWTLGTLASGGSETLTVTLTVGASAAAGTDAISASASLGALNETDTDSSDDAASESTSIASEVDLSVSVTESIDPVVAGSGSGNLVYTVTVSNDGPSLATGVELENSLTLPADVTEDSQVPSAGTFSDPIWTLGTLAPGASETLTVTLTAGASAVEGSDVIANAAAITAVNESDTDDSNDSAAESSSISSQIDLALSMTETSGVSAVPLGGALTYELTVANSGSDAEGVVLTETVPENAEYDSESSSGGWQCEPDASAGSTCTLEVGDLPGGGESSATFAILVDEILSRDVTEIVNGASAGTEAGDEDATPADNSDRVSTDVDLPPIVERVDTVSSTVSGQLEDGGGPRVPVTQLLLEFSEEVTGAAAASSFLLIEAGEDDLFSSTCSGVSGDDGSIPVESTVYDESGTYDGPTTRLELGSGLPLPSGRYRILACGGAIEDAAA